MNGKGWARTREIEDVELLVLLALAESWRCAETTVCESPLHQHSRMYDRAG